MDSLSQQLSDLIDPSPTLIDPEDDIDVETSAKILLSEKRDDIIESQDISSQTQISVLRRQNNTNLSDINQRYSGIKVNRNSINNEIDSDLYSEDNSQSEAENSEKEDEEQTDLEDDNEEEVVEFYSDNMRAPTASAEEFDSGSNESDLNEEEDFEEEFKEQNIDSNDEYINQFSNIDVSNQISKGKALKNQLIIWDNLLEFRIKAQKLLIDSNKCPQFDYFSQIVESDNNQLKNCLKESSKAMKRLLDVLTEIDWTLDSQNKLLKTDSVMSEVESQLMTDSIESKSGVKRKFSDCNQYSEYLAKRHSNLVNIRDNMIDNWYEKTRFTSSAFKQKSFNGLEESSTQQIHRILSDMERLIARTQTKRSLYSIIGKNDINSQSIETNQLEDQNNCSVNNKESDPEIFDDDDFYHQLLRELIESKTVNDTNDPTLLSGKWIQIQKLRNKIRRKVDTKASKGRKIRFDVHSKLVNFMAPVDNSTFTDEAKTQLFSSLFR